MKHSSCYHKNSIIRYIARTRSSHLQFTRLKQLGISPKTNNNRNRLTDIRYLPDYTLYHIRGRRNPHPRKFKLPHRGIPRGLTINRKHYPITLWHLKQLIYHCIYQNTKLTRWQSMRSHRHAGFLPHMRNMNTSTKSSRKHHLCSCVWKLYHDRKHHPILMYSDSRNGECNFI